MLLRRLGIAIAVLALSLTLVSAAVASSPYSVYSSSIQKQVAATLQAKFRKAAKGTFLVRARVECIPSGGNHLDCVATIKTRVYVGWTVTVDQQTGLWIYKLTTNNLS